MTLTKLQAVLLLEFVNNERTYAASYYPPMRKLIEFGLIEIAPNGRTTVTDAGRAEAAKIQPKEPDDDPAK